MIRWMGGWEDGTVVEGTNDDDDDTPDRQTDRRDVSPGGEDPVGASERGGINQ